MTSRLRVSKASDHQGGLALEFGVLIGMDSLQAECIVSVSLSMKSSRSSLLSESIWVSSISFVMACVSSALLNVGQ